MSILFYVSAAVALVCGLMVITQTNAMRALLNLVVLLLAVASVFYTLGGPFIAVLQIVIYAGAIMVLFVFTIMMLNLGGESQVQERAWIQSVFWALPLVLAAALLAMFSVTLASREAKISAAIAPKTIGISLFTNYIIGVELASMLLLAALVAAMHFGWISSRLERNDE